MIKQIFDGDEKKRITRQILETLPDWFGIPEIGMGVCYYNPKGKRKPENVSVDYEIKSIRELVSILL